jgi:hypothetical protein
MLHLSRHDDVRADVPWSFSMPSLPSSAVTTVMSWLSSTLVSGRCTDVVVGVVGRDTRLRQLSGARRGAVWLGLPGPRFPY